MKISDFVARADELLALGEKTLSTQRTSTNAWRDWVDTALFAEFRSSSLAFLVSVFGDKHIYARDFDKLVAENSSPDVARGRGILQAAKSEVSGGWTVSARSLLAAEIFSDFLEMSKYLLASGYKDPAAVVGGSLLEEHLRQLCGKHGVLATFTDTKGNTSPKKADTMNANLATLAVYNKLDQKQVTAWLDLRNKAAHGKYSEYTKEQVSFMLQGIADIMTRVPP